MAFDFGAALTSAGNIQPALQAQQQKELEQRRAQQQFEQQQKSSALMDLYRKSELDKLNLDTQRQREAWIPVRSYVGQDKSKHTIYQTPTGFQDKVDTPAPPTYEQIKDKLIHDYNGEQNIPPGLLEQAEAGSLGLKLPVSHLQSKIVIGPDEKSMLAGFDSATNTYYDSAGKPIQNARPYVKPSASTPYSDWKAQNPKGTVDQWLALNSQERSIYPRIVPVNDSLGNTTGFVEFEGNKSPKSVSMSSIPGAPSVIPFKPNAQDRATLETDQQITDTTSQLLPKLEKMKNENSLEDRAKMELAWRQYQLGFAPSDPELAEIIKDVAFLSIAGAGPWTRIGRNRYTFETIQKHLPKPNSTPEQIYQQVKWLTDNVIPSSQRSIRHLGQTVDSGGAGGSKSFSVKAPDGNTYTFKDQASADAFKKDAGIQ